MNRVSVSLGCSFADAEIEDYTYDKAINALTVHVRCWNARLVAVRFSSVHAVYDRCGTSVSEFVEEGAGSDLLQQALRYHYEQPLSPHSLRVFQFMNLEGEPMLEVVAVEVEVDGG